MGPDHLGDLQKALRIFAAANIALFICAVALGSYSYIVNHNRINDIQQSRVTSCERTYQAFDEVFHPLFPPPPCTPEQQKTLDTFNATVARLKRGCTRQTNS